MTLSRVPRAVLFLAAVAAVYLTFVLIHVSVAHADEGQALPPVPGVDWSVILLGLIAGLSAVRTFLVFLAPRTTTTVDDRALAIINAALSLVPRVPVPVDPGGLTAVKHDSQAGKATLGLLATLVLGSVLTATVVGFAAAGCATARPVAGEIIAAELDCTSAAMVDTAKSLGNVAQAYLVSKVSGDGRTVDTAAVKADMRALGSKAWSCAMSVALGVILGQSSMRTLADAGPDWRGALAEVKGELGVTTVKLPGGKVL